MPAATLAALFPLAAQAQMYIKQNGKLPPLLEGDNCWPVQLMAGVKLAAIELQMQVLSGNSSARAFAQLEDVQFL